MVASSFRGHAAEPDNRMSCADSLLVANAGSTPTTSTSRRKLLPSPLSPVTKVQSRLRNRAPSPAPVPRCQASSARSSLSPGFRPCQYGRSRPNEMLRLTRGRDIGIRHDPSPTPCTFRKSSLAAIPRIQCTRLDFRPTPANRSAVGAQENLRSSNLVPAVSTIRMAAATARVQACRNLLRSAGTEPLPRQWSRIRRAKSAHGV